MTDLEIYKFKKDYKIPEKELGRVFKKAERLLKLRNFKISLAIVDDKTIRELNKKYRFRDKVTDVLSFEMSPLIFNTDYTDDECGSSATCCASKCSAGACHRLRRGLAKGDDPPQMGGEIVISYPEAKRQAGEFKEPIQKVILRLFVHGLLHLAGYGHKTKDDYNKMIKIQNELLEC